MIRWPGRGVVCAAWLLVWTAASGCDGSGQSGTGGSAGATSDGGAGAASTGGGGATASNTGGATSTGTGGAGTGGSATGGAGTGGAAGGAGGGGAGGGGGAMGLPDLGTLVVLGDSISDGGGEAPYYYNLLKADLEAKYGAISYQKKAQSGSKTGALVGQINNLPNNLPGPVAVVITSGGNDMKAALPQVVLGADQAALAQVQQNIKAALDKLLAPNQFGPGVEVHVYEGNIYDASDGAGDFGQNGCAFGQGLPAIPTDGFFDKWNGVIATEVSAHAQVLADMHAHFYGHGYKSSPNWYASDCTHPSAVGHDQLRKLFYSKITGEALP